MYQGDKFIYIQMQKTASAHIVQLLEQLFDGNIIGKHNYASVEQIENVPYFIASIRNPWEWYLSLWAFGVGKRGSLWRMLTQPRQRNLKNIYRTFVRDNVKHDVQKWRKLYQRSDDVAAFREWLRLLHDPANASELGEGYASSGISEQGGFMTYRYLRLCCRFDCNRFAQFKLNDHAAIKQFDAEQCYIDYFIRQENLVETFIEAVERIRALSAAEKSLVQNAPRTNTSTHELPLSEYYDQASIDLILARDKLLIEKFNYSPINVTQ